MTTTTLKSQMAEFFAQDGPLASLLDGYQPRAAQVEMAEAVADALEAPGRRAVIEAGTGTGKSLAYLVPSLLSGKQVCVATGTKALQDQLFEKDLPLVLEAIEAFNGEKKRGALMKGRQNYLCLTRWERFNSEPTFAFASDSRHLLKLRKFVEKTETGDRAEVDGLPEPFSTWPDLDAGSETCIGQKCPAFDDCYVTKMRRRAETADVVVANHHLLCADLRVRFEGVPGGGKSAAGAATLAQVIPEVDAFILDEAHQLPDVATSYFGVSFSTGRIDRLEGDLSRRVHGAPEVKAGLERSMAAFGMAFEQLLARLGPQVADSRDRVTLGPELSDEEMAALGQRLEKALADVCMRLETLAEAQPPLSGEGAELEGLARRVEQMAAELGFLIGPGLSDARFVTWMESFKRGFTIASAPVDVAAALQATLFESDRPVVLTSATLAVDGSTAGFEDRIGVAALDASEDNDGEEDDVAQTTLSLVLPSPFEFDKRAALYAPSDMPVPDDDAFFERFCEELKFLAKLSGGGLLALFTSYRMLDKSAERLEAELEELGLDVLKQGDAPKLKLLETLKEADGKGAALFATQSFWEGVDLPGEALRVVVIDRLPFKPPTDPVLRARHRVLEERGLRPFDALTVPEAALGLKQGVGRLIRTESDAGVVAVLDGRLRKKRYGQVFLRTLPPMLRLGSQKVVRQFWERVVEGHEG